MATVEQENPLVANFDLLINGEAVPVALAAHVSSITVDDDALWPCMFALEVSGSDNYGEERVWVDDELFAVGNSIEIKMGYAEDLQTVLVGEVTGLEPEFLHHRLPSLLVRGYDRRHRLMRGRKTRTFVQQKDSDIAAQIADEAGLAVETQDSGVQYDYVLQANETDMEFLQARARRIGYELLMVNKKLIFRAASSGRPETLSLSPEHDLLEFRPRLSSLRQASEVTWRGWDAKEKREILGRAGTGNETTVMGGRQSGAAVSRKAFGSAVEVVSERPPQTQAEADQLAAARFNDLALTFIEGEGVCRGNARLRAGETIKLEGLGLRFSGLYYVTAASHQYTSHHGYYTNFTVRRNAS